MRSARGRASALERHHQPRQRRSCPSPIRRRCRGCGPACSVKLDAVAAPAPAARRAEQAARAAGGSAWLRLLGASAAALRVIAPSAPARRRARMQRALRAPRADRDRRRRRRAAGVDDARAAVGERAARRHVDQLGHAAGDRRAAGVPRGAPRRGRAANRPRVYGCARRAKHLVGRARSRRRVPPYITSSRCDGVAPSRRGRG